eukprot:1809858-Pyramimonas_sp.AAC.1
MRPYPTCAEHAEQSGGQDALHRTLLGSRSALRICAKRLTLRLQRYTSFTSSPANDVSVCMACLSFFSSHAAQVYTNAHTHDARPCPVPMVSLFDSMISSPTRQNSEHTGCAA